MKKATLELEQAERELAEIKGLIDEQFGIVTRLKRLGADTAEAIRVLIDLLERQQLREQRLARVRLQRRRSIYARLALRPAPYWTD
jgi:hypothetical protein